MYKIPGGGAVGEESITLELCCHDVFAAGNCVLVGWTKVSLWETSTSVMTMDLVNNWVDKPWLASPVTKQ